MDVPRSRIAVLDGTGLAPGQPWRAWASKQSKHCGVNLLGSWVGKRPLRSSRLPTPTARRRARILLKTLLEKHAPCVVLIDELVAYVRQFPESQSLSGGSYDTNLSFVQALTEAAKLVPNAILLASLPESEIEAGSQRGVATLSAMEKTFGRVQALWKPVATEEAFEIVRRRSFRAHQRCGGS
jgi:predicted AAA+ superfamily ATPase